MVSAMIYVCGTVMLALHTVAQWRCTERRRPVARLRPSMLAVLFGIDRDALTCWNHAIVKIESLVPCAPLAPVFGVAFAALLLGELTIWHAVGLLVVAGRVPALGTYSRA